MSSKTNILTSFLLPLYDLESFRGTAVLAGSMSQVLGDRLEKICLLRVMEGSYVAKHMENIDVRVEHVISSALITRLRKEHMAAVIEPELKKAGVLLTESGVSVNIDRVVKEGMPADVIADLANKENYSTIIMQRRGLSTAQGMIVGSVTYRLLHRALKSTVYLTGTMPESRSCDTGNILIAVDGSEHSKTALDEAAVLLGKCDEMKQAVLVTITDVDIYRAAMDDGANPEKEAESLLDSAAAQLEENGVPTAKIVKVRRNARHAATVLEEEIKSRGIDTVLMGRRGRNTITEFFIGSVSRKIIDCCPEQTIGLVTAK